MNIFSLETNVHNLFLIANWLSWRKCQMLKLAESFSCLIFSCSVKHWAAFWGDADVLGKRRWKKVTFYLKTEKDGKWEFLITDISSHTNCICAWTFSPTPQKHSIRLRNGKRFKNFLVCFDVYVFRIILVSNWCRRFKNNIIISTRNT